ncbi:MAG: conserved hypothetical protein [Arenicellales bacterium IbO2]|nr:three-Cys-motif partner protein TcmP [Gammaproteobacteria bacterium]MDA8010575.1 three-Cys-motif partner protein TcmP [Alphaproteobacteria bacterium]CAJ2376305.1 MAG: conserved hypothetical protein [Arenicellales bacterium IbO2]
MKFDEIKRWSEIKLEILRKYAIPYAKIMSRRNFKFHYIDAFSGAGLHISKETGKIVDGSPLRVLKMDISFDSYHFVDLDKDKTGFLRDYCEENHPDRNVKVKQGDCNEVVDRIVSGMSFDNFDRILCLLDPYGLHLDWKVIEMMGKKGIVDLILNFPIMDMNRNAIWHDREKVSESGKTRMTRFWGDDSWRDDAYSRARQQELFGEAPLKKQSNEAIVRAFQARLRNVAEFKHVPRPVPMKNSKGPTVYYLFFASQNATAEKIAKSILKKYAE